MSKFKGNQAFKKKLARRIMAIVLSGAMVMSNMSAYAAELTTEPETEVVSEVEETAAADEQDAAVSESSEEKSNDENAETEAPAAESSESVATKTETEEATEDTVATENATETKTDDSVETETNTEAEKDTVAETEAESAENKVSETETDIEETTEEISDIETTEEETVEETNRDETPAVEGIKYTFNASEFMVTDADKTVVEAGTKIGTDDYFRVVSLGTYTDKGESVEGNTVKRGDATRTKALEITKESTAGIQFTVKGTADATFKVASTGGKNVSSIALIDSNKNIVKATEKSLTEGKDGDKETGVSSGEQADGSFLVYGNETKASTITFKGLKAGRYTIVSPKTDAVSRSAWVISAEVTDSGKSSEETVVTNEYTFNANEFMVTDADKTKVEAGTRIGKDDYFKVVSLGTYTDKGESVEGNTVKRGDATRTKALEITKESTAGIQFTIKGTADATFKVASTGGKNVSSIALIDSNKNIVKATEKSLTEGKDGDKETGVSSGEQDDGSFLVYGNETKASTITYKGLKAGTYTIVSPKTDAVSRSAWVISAAVSDTSSAGEMVTGDYVFNANEFMVTDADKTKVEAGTKIGTDDYFKVVSLGTYTDKGESVEGNTVKRGDATRTKALEITKESTAGIQFTVKGTADATFKVASTGGKNVSSIALIDSNKNIVKATEKNLTEGKDGDKETGVSSGEQDDGSFLVYGNETKASTITYKGLKAGTYTIVSPKTDAVSRSAWVISAAVSDTYLSGAGDSDQPVDWNEVKAPVILSAEQAKDKDGVLTNSINVKVQVVIHELKGCDKLEVEMYDSLDAAEPVETMSTARETETDIAISFTVSKSGTYYFKAKAIRTSETKILESEKFAMQTPFVLPLAAATVTRATNDGAGGIEIGYTTVPEADKYVAKAVQVTKNEDGTYTLVEGAEPIIVESTTTTAKFDGLTVGQYYGFSVHAVRGTEESKESNQLCKVVKDVAEQIWDYAVFGESASTDTAKCYYSGDANDGEVSVWSLNGSGKIVPASTDGLSFYYTKVDKDTNFVLEATAVVDEWTYSNGQEGFGLMVADTVGEIEAPKTVGTKFWNNSYMAVATKMEYYWNGSTVLPTTVGPGDDRVRYNMYIGLGSIVRTGVTDEWKAEEAAGATIPSKFVSEQLSLEHEAATKGLPGGGNYNIIGNRSGGTAIDIEPLLTEIKLRIEKNNTGYFITYIDKNGEETTQKYYDEAIYTSDYANQTLLQIDKENMYAGFFAARNAKVTFKDIRFTTSSVADGGAPEERPLVYNAPNYTILSGSVANTPEYEINFSTNWRGKLSIKDSAGRELLGEEYFDYASKTVTTVYDGKNYVPTSMLDKFFVYKTKEVTEKDENGNDITKQVVDIDTVLLKEDVKAIIPINEDVNKASKLAIGGNQFTVSFTPDRSWHKNDDEIQVLTSYDTSVQTMSVSYRQYGEEGANLYVSPEGKASGDGTKESPLDIYTAVKYAQAGQTIVLLKGTYSLKKPLTIERGVDGTAEKPIRMIAEPGTYDRTKPFEPGGVVIDFNGVASGMTIAGDYWYLRGFDVTNSSDGNKGVQVSGSHNVLDQINTYYNGNTGIQISRYKGGDIDKSDDWPAYNTILNCTSYLNADSGHEDADGFAAKLTIGDGNVFDGCIGAYNADDGWDFFAKSESGPIGQVIIKNSVAYKNGYLITKNGKLDVTGTEMMGNGNGNGFKMGGENIRGYHMVMNSYAFLNKSNGIDCNSCPDIQVYNCIAYDNGGIVNGDAKANVRFQSAASQTAFRARNLISFKKDVALDIEENVKPIAGTPDLNDHKGASNFYWDVGTKTSKNDSGKTVAEDWFESLDYKGITTVSRNENGTIHMGGFLALKDTVDKTSFVKLMESTNDAGAKIYVTAEGESGIDGIPGIGGEASDSTKAEVDNNKDTSGNIVSGDDEDLSSTDTWTDEEFAQLDVNGTTLKILLDLDYNRAGYYADYTGIALKPSVRVAYGPNELSNKNYSISYKNNTKAYELRPGDEGFDEKLAPAVVIKGKGNYSGEYKLYFVINKIDLESDKVTSADIATVATGKAQKINPIVTFDGKKLGAKDYTISRRYTIEPITSEDGTETGETKEVDYTGSYESAGTYYIELEAVDGGNFEGTKTIAVKVLSEAEAAGKTSISKAKVDKIPDQIYDGKAHSPVVAVAGLTASMTDAEGNYVQGDYDVDYYNNTNIGVASVVLTGNLEKGYYGTKTVTFRTIAKPFNVKDYSVTVRGTFDGQTYEATTDEQYKSLQIPSTGSAITFSNVIVKVIANEGSEDVRLREGIDYTVSYRGNTKAGSASIVIKGMGDFTGSMKRSFKITPFEINPSNTIVDPIADQTYIKGGVKPSVIVRVNGKVVSAKNYTVSYKNNNKLGTATVSITGKNLLKGSLKDVGSFVINAKNLRSTNIIADNVYYGTAKNAGDGIAYLTKLVVKDGNKTLSLNSDYMVTYYEADGTPVFNYNTGELKFRKAVTVDNGDGTTRVEQQEVAATPLEKNSKITYDGSNKTIYAVITGGNNKLYEGATFASYKVVGKNDIKTAKITKITDVYTYNDGNMAAPKLEVKIQNRHLENGKYVKDAELTTLNLNEDYEITNLKNNDRAGTCTITIKGMGYYSGTNKVNFKIVRKDLSAWNAYLSNAAVAPITVDVNEADVAAGGQYASGFTFDEITNAAGEKEASPLAKAATGKIYTIGTKESITLAYGTDYLATSYSNNVVDVSKLIFDEAGYAYQTATVTIKGEGSFTGNRTIQFTIRVKKAETV